MSDNFKFKVGDLVRPITASKKSRVWKVLKNITQEESSKLVSAFVGRTVVSNKLEVQCQSFAYNKIQIKYFDQDELVLANT